MGTIPGGVKLCKSGRSTTIRLQDGSTVAFNQTGRHRYLRPPAGHLAILPLWFRLGRLRGTAYKQDSQPHGEVEYERVYVGVWSIRDLRRYSERAPASS